MTGQTVTRAQLTEAVYEEVGLSRNESAELVENVLDEMIEALSRVRWSDLVRQLSARRGNGRPEPQDR